MVVFVQLHRVQDPVREANLVLDGSCLVLGSGPGLVVHPADQGQVFQEGLPDVLYQIQSLDNRKTTKRTRLRISANAGNSGKDNSTELRKDSGYGRTPITGQDSSVGRALERWSKVFGFESLVQSSFLCSSKNKSKN